MGRGKSGEMQLGEADRIEVAFREDAGARLAAIAWFEKKAAAPWEYWLARVVSGGAHALLAGVVGAGLVFAFVPDIRFTMTFAIVFALLAGYGWAGWITSYQRRVSGAFDTEAWGDMSYVFTPDGGALVDDLRHWRTGWRGVALISAEPEGLFLATKGVAFYVPAGCWTDPAAMREDAARVETWWRASGAKL